MKIIVLAKQVPDTRNVGKDAMKEDGTINRAVLPAIFNPEDLNALEQALRLKEQHPGTTVTILTMGPGRAAEIIREGLYRGADDGYLLTDRAFAGADTLATSYALAMAIKERPQLIISDVEEFMQNVTPREQYELLELQRVSGFVDRAKGLGRPTKKDRRDLDQFAEELPEGIEIFDWDEEWD